MDRKTIEVNETKLYQIKTELCPNCDVTVCFQCPFNMLDQENGDDMCAFDFIIERAETEIEK